MPEMVEVVIDSVRVSLMSPQRLVVLRQLDADRFLPIWVGPYEAEAITVALQEIEMARPLTHDLLKNIFTAFNTRIMRVEIVSLREDIYYGNIIAETNEGQKMTIDSRPSDAIALAVRAHVPILVSPEVMNSAGIIPEKDIATQTPPPSIATASAPAPLSKSTPSQPANPADERLSVFEDFLSNIDLDKPPSEGKPPATKKKPASKKPKKKDDDDSEKPKNK
jgi:uncharacterized protein